MGVSAIPYDTIPKAKRFKRRMSKPWIAKVYKEPNEDYYSWKHPDSDLIRSDSLWDDFDAQSDKKKDFDIRPFVKREVRSYLNEPDPTAGGEPLEAINIVRVAVGLEKFDPKSVVSIKAPIEYLKEQGFQVRRYGLDRGKDMSAGMARYMRVQKFARLKDVYIFDIAFKGTRRIAEVKRVLKQRFDVLSVTKRYPEWNDRRIVVIRMKP